MIEIFSRRTFDLRIRLYLSNRCAKFGLFKLWRYFVRTNRRYKLCWIICKSGCFYSVEFVREENSMTPCSWATWDENENSQRNVCVTSNNVKSRLTKIVSSLEVKSRWINVNLFKSQHLTVERKLERLHKNVNNIITHLLNLNPFFTEIRALIKEIMITIADDWNISLSSRKRLWKEERRQRSNWLNFDEWWYRHRDKFKKAACGWHWPIIYDAGPRLFM